MNLTCKKCGWVYFGVSREHAEAEVKRFNEYFYKLSQKNRKRLYGNKPASIQLYEKCWCGNDYTNFRPSRRGDCPDGCTISPIIIGEKEE